jgi:peptidyl-prolyl cis-trans isomerase SurA
VSRARVTIVVALPWRLRRTLTASSRLLLAVLVFAPEARASTVERIAAVVGDHVVLLGEVREEAAPYVAALHETDPLARARQESKLLREACERMIDDLLIEDEAERLHVEVTSGEVDDAIASLAKQNGMSVPEILKAARDQGYGEPRYREAVRVQLLHGKLLQLRRPDPQKVEEADRAFVAELREKTYVEDRLAP